MSEGEETRERINERDRKMKILLLDERRRQGWITLDHRDFMEKRA